MSSGSSQMLLRLLLFGLLLRSASSETDPLDAVALRALYGALNSPPQLEGWTSEGGDPCRGEPPWKGVSCSNLFVTSIKINGLGLGGCLGSELSSFKSLNDLDVSANTIGGEIPHSLPPNATHLNLSCNQFVNGVPFTLPHLKSLTYLNLSHNSLSGPVGNMFTNFQNLKQMDLSFNYFSGDLPNSFSSLTNLHELYLQENDFTGSVTFLANLPLSILNLENNQFSGVIPKQFESIHQLKIDGNIFQPRYAFPPSYFNGYSLSPSTGNPIANVTPDWNVSHNPISTTNSFHHSSQKEVKHKQQMFSPGVTSGTICGVFVMALAVTAIFIIHNRKPHSHRSRLDKHNSVTNPIYALPVTTSEVPRFNNDQYTFRSLSMKSPRCSSIHHIKTARVSRCKSYLGRARSLSTVKPYSASDMLIVTDSFNEKNLLGEDLFGLVYKAEFPDGQICVVKKLEMETLSVHEEDEFIDFVWNMSHLKHPNIIRLLGYSIEQGQHILVYEYVKNVSLDDLLHPPDRNQKLLSWRARVKIAFGVAHALEYLHCTCCPPIAHGNLTAAKILLDDQLMPHLSDCGLAMLWHLINIEPGASKQAIGDASYAAPEFGVPGTDKTMCDIYSFGVLLLELLTGRRPFDSSSSGDEEQSIVMWASDCLHNVGLLEILTDPTIEGTISSKARSQFTDIILLCIQPKPESRPPITEIVDMLVCATQSMSHHWEKQDGAEEVGFELDMSQQSFMTRLDHF